MDEPSIVMPLLGSQVAQVRSNARMSAFVTADGQGFVMGRDFKCKSHGDSTRGKSNFELDFE